MLRKLEMCFLQTWIQLTVTKLFHVFMVQLLNQAKQLTHLLKIETFTLRQAFAGKKWRSVILWPHSKR